MPLRSLKAEPSNEPDLIIREYREDDAIAVRHCIVELQEFERQIDDRLRPGESMADAYLAHVLDRCRTCAGAILVAERAGEIAGFATILARVRTGVLSGNHGAARLYRGEGYAPYLEILAKRLGKAGDAR